MLPQYQDILDLAGDREPLWWDENGVPRFAPFHPRYLGVYDEMAVLAEVTCQSCDKVMLVGLGRPKIEVLVHYRDDGSYDPQVVHNTLAGLIKIVEAWGDPPRHNCPGAGETMSAKSVVVTETWTRSRSLTWRPNLKASPPAAGTRPRAGRATLSPLRASPAAQPAQT